MGAATRYTERLMVVAIEVAGASGSPYFAGIVQGLELARYRPEWAMALLAQITAENLATVSEEVSEAGAKQFAEAIPIELEQVEREAVL